MLKLNFEIDKDRLDRQVDKVLEEKLEIGIANYIDDFWSNTEFAEKFDKQILEMLDTIFIEKKEYFKNKLEEVIKRDIEVILLDSINEYFDN